MSISEERWLFGDDNTDRSVEVKPVPRTVRCQLDCDGDNPANNVMPNRRQVRRLADSFWLDNPEEAW